MPTRTAVPTLLGGLNIEISGEEGDWRVQPGDVEVLAVKSVRYPPSYAGQTVQTGEG